MNRARFLSLTLAVMASALLAGAAEAKGPKIKRSGSSDSSSGSTRSGGTPVVVPTGRSGKEDCTLIADPGRRHDCAAKQIGR